MIGAALLVLAAILAGLFLSSGGSGGLTGDDYVSLIYAGLFATVIGAFFFQTRQRFGNVARQILIWIAILLALVAAYEYRFELQDFGARVSAGLVPGSARTRTAEDGATLVQINRIGQQFLTDGSVNGSRQGFLVDTGASTVVLTANGAREAGIEPQSLSFTIPVNTANGVTMAARTRVDTLTIGGIERDDVIVLVSEPGDLGVNLLGMNFLDTLAGYEVRGDRLILRD